MTDQTSPATALPVVAWEHNEKKFVVSHPVPRTWSPEKWSPCVRLSDVQATIDVLRAEVERLQGTLTMLRNHTAVSENQMLMIDDALHRLTDSALPGEDGVGNQETL